MHVTAATFAVPHYSSAVARRDYAYREAERYRLEIRKMWNRGVRRPGEIAAELNLLGIPTSTGQPWKSRIVAAKLNLLRFDRQAETEREIEALEEVIEELWGVGYRVPRQIARVLERLEISCPWGGAWSAAKANRLLQRHAGDWMINGVGVRLRHGDDALKLEGFPELPALGRRRATAPALPAPQEAASRRRAVRIS